MPLMTVNEICKVISAWIKEELDLGSKFEWVQIFENKGEIMGCSNPHPHCQIWASSFLPNEPRLEDAKQREYWNSKKRLLLRDYLEEELKKDEPNRIVLSNESWVVLVSIIIILNIQLKIIAHFGHSIRYHFGLFGLLKPFFYREWMFNVYHN